MAAAPPRSLGPLGCFDSEGFELRREDPMDKDTLPPTWENETGSSGALG